MQRVLVIGYVWPEPNSSAAGSQMLQLLNFFLEQHYQINFASPAIKTPHMFDLATLDVQADSIELNNSSFDEYVTTLQPNIVLFDRFMMEEQFGWRVENNCPNALRVLLTVDLHCVRDARQQALKQNREMTQHDLQSTIAMREIASILRSDLSLLISKFEYDLLINEFTIDKKLLLLVPFMLETITRQDIQQLPKYSERHNFISIGNFRHEPNWDAVLYLKNSIWPLIRKQLPDAQMHIYGSYPSEKAMQLNNKKENFLVMGWAEDVYQVMQKCRICLAPLRFGAGIKGKLIDAMLTGTASITSSIGAEAMHGNLDNQLPWNGIITDDPEYFAKSAVALYNNEAAWCAMQDNGIKIINRYYDKNKISEYLAQRITELLSSLTQSRLDNFYGTMLRHHSMKSTEYMSRWIEEKNKDKI
ncbi:Glutamate synthase [NADPH] large chain [hydrothermal vent metagenome]|uniref:Glutamate synthase [NADPH] large chain n=1 Tax=hydrothermal vent metagenome TaxID=652676 RepID=A0A3B1AJP3_9ZZZZ